MIHPFSSVQNTTATQAAHTTAYVTNQPTQAAVQNPNSTSQISEQARNLAQSDSAYLMDTGAGKRHLDLKAYFDVQGVSTPHTLNDVGDLLTPSAHNIQVLEKHISSVFPRFLSDNKIPEAPEKISFDNSGQLVLPADYQHADKLKQALEENPAMEKLLSSTNALSSHVAALQELQPFHNAFAQANSDAERDEVLAKYRHLISNNHSYPEISLMFNKNGGLTVNADNKALV